MFEHRDPKGNQYKTYHVAADEFELDEGDRIRPGSEIGVDANSGAPIYADYWGSVATVYYNPMSHSLLVMIYKENNIYITLNSEFSDLVTVDTC